MFPIQRKNNPLIIASALIVPLFLVWSIEVGAQGHLIYVDPSPCKKKKRGRVTQALPGIRAQMKVEQHCEIRL